MLTEQELIHYSRHIILPEIDEAGQRRLKDASVLIVGMGGLGSPVAMYLAAAGIGHLLIADHDIVEQSNLQRQIAHNLPSVGNSKVLSAKTTLEQLNPWIKVTTITQKFIADSHNELIAKVDLVVDCSDNYTTRFALNKSCIAYGKPLVSGTAMRFNGQVAVFNQDAHSACYHCLYQSDNFNTESCDDQGILAPVVGVIGSLQATEVLKIILKIGQTLDSRLLIYDGLKAQFSDLKLVKDPACKVCGQ